MFPLLSPAWPSCANIGTPIPSRNSLSSWNEMESSTLAQPHSRAYHSAVNGLAERFVQPLKCYEGLWGQRKDAQSRAVPTEQKDVDGGSSSVSADDKMAILTSPRFQDVKHTQHRYGHLVRRSQKCYPHFFQQWAWTVTAVFHSVQPVVVRTPQTLNPQMTTRSPYYQYLHSLTPSSTHQLEMHLLLL